MTVGAWYRARLRERDKEIDRLRAQNLALRAQLLPDTNEGDFPMNYATTDLRSALAKELYARTHADPHVWPTWAALDPHIKELWLTHADVVLEAVIPPLAHRIVKSTNMRWQHDGTPTVVGPVTQGHAESVLRA